jgi:hypothetical protein
MFKTSRRDDILLAAVAGLRFSRKNSGNEQLMMLGDAAHVLAALILPGLGLASPATAPATH